MEHTMLSTNTRMTSLQGGDEEIIRILPNTTKTYHHVDIETMNDKMEYLQPATTSTTILQQEEEENVEATSIQSSIMCVDGIATPTTSTKATAATTSSCSVFNPIFMWDFTKQIKIGKGNNRKPIPQRQCSKSTLDTTTLGNSTSSEDEHDDDVDEVDSRNVQDDDDAKQPISQPQHPKEDCHPNNEDPVVATQEVVGNVTGGLLPEDSCHSTCQSRFQRFESSNDSIELTLSTSGDVTVCSCLNSLEIEKTVLRRESVNDLMSSGAQLSAVGSYEASRLRYQLTLEALKKQCCTDESRRRSKQKTNKSSSNLHKLANLCYTCGQLSRKLRDFKVAADYFRQELQYTSQYTALQDTPSAAGDLCMAKCYDALARLHQYDMGETDTALQYYELALQHEEAAVDKIQQLPCSICGNSSLLSKDSTGSDECSTTSMPKTSCCHVQALLEHLQRQMHETKMKIGRIHFMNGHLDRAIKLTIQKSTVV
jgi:tetratricopeptide (TPR) repeat protein